MALVEAVRARVRERFGFIDVLDNNAGVALPTQLVTETTLADWRRVMDTNATGMFLASRAVLPEMVSQQRGSIVNISSMNAFTPLTKIPAYSGAKAAVSNFTQWLAVHFANCNIRVNAIAPGFFATNQNRTLLFNEDGSLTPRSHKIISQTPMGRFGEPEELLGTLRFLIDNDASGFVTGITIPVDGGFSAYSGV